MFKYEVSNFARDLLSRVHNDPLFNILAINKTLYKKVKELDDIKVWKIYVILIIINCYYIAKHK